MREHQHKEVLYEDAQLRLYELHCRRFGCSRRFWEERSEDHEIVFMRSGLYVRHVGRDELVGDANHVQFFNRDEPNKTTHPVPGGDDSTVVALNHRTLIELIERFDPWVRDRPETPFDYAQCLFSRRSHMLHQDLLGQVWRGVDTLCVQETAVELVESVMETVYQRCAAPSSRPGRASADHRQLAEEAKMLLNERMTEAPTLPELARALYTSPYHLARIFRREIGVSLHQYLSRLRLRTALEHLLAGESDLSALAHRMGFADHSHFTNAFRREFGMPPSAWRRRWHGHRFRAREKLSAVS